MINFPSDTYYCLMEDDIISDVKVYLIFQYAIVKKLQLSTKKSFLWWSVRCWAKESLIIYIRKENKIKPKYQQESEIVNKF